MKAHVSKNQLTAEEQALVTYQCAVKAIRLAIL